jgi:biotin transport system substrate-specific component
MMQDMSFATYFRPGIKKQAVVYDLVLIFGASIFIALSAQLAFPVPLSPVPITMQTFAVLLISALLGSRLGTTAVLAYLLEGAIGLPVFAQGHAGFAYIFGATGGYLLGFIPAAYITGRLAEKKSASLFRGLLLMTVGTLLIFFCGLSWLSLVFNTTDLLVVGFYPFLPGAIIKIVAAALIYIASIKTFASKND